MPRPTISGTVTRRIDMNHFSAGKNKDYRITIAQQDDGTFRVYTEHGPAGSLRNGKEVTAAGISASRAEDLADNIRDGKIKQADSYSVERDVRFNATPQPAAVPASKPPPAPARKLIQASSLSPASRAALATIF